MGNSLLSKIMGIIIKSDVDYFDMCVKGAEISLRAALALKHAFEDEKINEHELVKIRDIEHEGDRHVHDSLQIVNDAFITPIDQSDLLDILKGIEDVTDYIDDVAAHCYMLDIHKSDMYIDRFIDIMVITCQKQCELMKHLKNIKKLPFEQMKSLISEINSLEEDADRVYQMGMRNLFTNGLDAIEIVRRKEIYIRLEDVLDGLERVANVVFSLMVAKL
ncbi:MAG: hypothetical protein CVU94_07410 [Firmicutes bacterium HGW-Firmicutes-19]|jgi:uncharacterized protein|nr:MAG: hypothetical protein CVU94_07410 [Firmicutes bacterium HGW-Firmicutes-19]